MKCPQEPIRPAGDRDVSSSAFQMQTSTEAIHTFTKDALFGLIKEGDQLSVADPQALPGPPIPA